MLGVEDHSLAVREDTNGTWWQMISGTSEFYVDWCFGVVVGDESST